MPEPEIQDSLDGPMQNPETHRQAYDRLKPLRESYLVRGRECSKLTIPRLLKEQGATGSTSLPTPFQSMGPRGVNNLSNKLLMALFPPNIPFFKYKVEPYAKELENAAADGDKDKQTEIEAHLIKAELAVQGELETSGWRVIAHEALQQLVTVGNCLVCMPKGDTRARIYKLDQYVMERSPMGHPIEIVVLEKVSERMLDDDLKEMMQKTAPKSSGNSDRDQSNPTYELYTRCIFDGEEKKWHCSQQLETMDIEGSYGTYGEDEFPYIPVRGYNDSGEHFSRSYVEDYLGDLISLEGLSQAIVEYAAACANVKFLVKPASLTDKDELANMPNGGYGDGSAEDVTVVSLDKFADFQVSANAASELKRELSLVFLLNSSIQRSGERVTAEEIRYMAEELESTLGGAYSLLSLEFQLPLVNLLTNRMTAAGRLPKLPNRVIKPTIVTGIEAIGRGNDASRLLDVAQGVRETFGETASVNIFDPYEFTSRLAIARGVRAEGLVRPPEQRAAQDQQAMIQMLIEKLGPEYLKQMGAAGQSPQLPQGAVPQPQ